MFTRANADLSQGELEVGAFVVRGALVDDRMDDGMREREVTVDDLLLEGDKIFVALFVSGAAPDARLTREAGKSHVDGIGRPAEHADAGTPDSL